MNVPALWWSDGCTGVSASPRNLNCVVRTLLDVLPPPIVIPAKAGIHFSSRPSQCTTAFAGVTSLSAGLRSGSSTGPFLSGHPLQTYGER